MKLNKHEQNYVNHELELETIIHVLKMWRHYLLSKRFVLMSNHGGLRYLFDQSNLNSRKARWLATISDFEFDIRYIKIKDNRDAYDLSRRVQMNNNDVAYDDLGDDMT